MILKTFRIACIVLAVSVVVVAPPAGSPDTSKSTAGSDCPDWLRRAFWKAASATDVERCLAAGARSDARGRTNGMTRLHVAAYLGNAAAVRVLVAARAKIDARDEDRRTPLHVAPWAENVETVTTLIAAGARIDLRDEDSRTPLHHAARHDNVEAITALIDAGAEIDTRDEDSRTPLHVAARRGRAKAIITLLDADADGAVREADGKTPFDLLRQVADSRWLKMDAWHRLLDARSR